MLYIFHIFLLPLVVLSANGDVTFKNVEFKGYSVYVLKFTKTIESSNSLKEHVPNIFFDHLEFLDQYIPVLHENSVTDLQTLDELTIENCQLKEIQPGAFKNLPSLRKLNLRRNNLGEIATGIFNNLPISMLDLSKNKIKNIDASAFNDLPNILNVNLADNLISVWNKRWFHNTPLLTRISMQNNSLETIPTQAFTNLNGDKNFGSVKLTINLIFSYNKISEIEEGAFQGLKTINNLWLDNNKLTEFKDTLLDDVKVEDLRIEHNQLRCLTGDLGKIIKAKTTHVDGNPFDCECLEKIKEWAKEHNKIVEMFYSEVDCSVNRIKKKMNSLEKRLKEVFKKKDVEEVIPKSDGSSNEIEILFK